VILDTSAVVAIVMQEPGFEELLVAMAGVDAAVGTAILAEASVTVIPFGESHYGVAWLADEPLPFVGSDFLKTDIAHL
jgi:uncharacterized protein with PIN domain